MISSASSIRTYEASGIESSAPDSTGRATRRQAAVCLQSAPRTMGGPAAPGARRLVLEEHGRDVRVQLERRDEQAELLDERPELAGTQPGQRAQDMLLQDLRGFPQHRTPRGGES